MKRRAVETNRLSRIVVAAALAWIPVQSCEAQAENEPAKGGDPILMMIDAAAARDGGANLLVVLETAIAVAPERREELIAYARKSAPEGADFSAVGSARTAASAQPKSGAVASASVKSGQGDEAYPLFEGEVDLGGTFNTGNTSEKALAVALKVGYDTGLWQHVLATAFDYSRKEGLTTKERWFLSYQVNRDIGQRFYGFGRGEYVKDRFTGFDYRLYGGGGLGYRLVEQDDMEWSLEAGPGARYSQVVATGLAETEFTFRLASAFEWEMSETARITQGVEYLMNGTRTLDATTALTVKLSEKLSGRASFTVRNDSDPPPGVEPTDTTTKASLVYGF